MVMSGGAGGCSGNPTHSLRMLLVLNYEMRLKTRRGVWGEDGFGSVSDQRAGG